MHINQISYQKTFNLGNYSSERIGVEIGLEAGEDAKVALDTAKQLVEEYHKGSRDLVTANLDTVYVGPIIPEIQVQKQPEVREQTLEEQIRSCTDITVLKAYQLLVKKDPILQKAYDDTMSTIKFHKM